MNLVLYLDPDPVTFSRPLSGGENPFLLSIGSFRLTARAGSPIGFGVGETGSLSVDLDVEALPLLERALRSRAQLREEDGTVIAEGVVSRLMIEQTIAMEIEP